jgi:hypothetical protein
VSCCIHSGLATKTRHKLILQTLLTILRKSGKEKKMQENEDNKFELLRLRANYEQLHAVKFVIFCHQSAAEKGKV